MSHAEVIASLVSAQGRSGDEPETSPLFPELDMVCEDYSGDCRDIVFWSLFLGMIANLEPAEPAPLPGTVTPGSEVVVGVQKPGGEGPGEEGPQPEDPVIDPEILDEIVDMIEAEQECKDACDEGVQLDGCVCTGTGGIVDPNSGDDYSDATSTESPDTPEDPGSTWFV